MPAAHAETMPIARRDHVRSPGLAGKVSAAFGGLESEQRTRSGAHARTHPASRDCRCHCAAAPCARTVRRRWARERSRPACARRHRRPPAPPTFTATPLVPAPAMRIRPLTTYARASRRACVRSLAHAKERTSHRPVVLHCRSQAPRRCQPPAASALRLPGDSWRQKNARVEELTRGFLSCAAGRPTLPRRRASRLCPAAAMRRANSTQHGVQSPVGSDGW